MPTYESYVTNTKKTAVTRRGLNRGGTKAKGTSYASPRKRVRPVANRASLQKLREEWAEFLYSHGLRRASLSKSFPGIKPLVVAAIKDTPHQDELDSSMKQLSRMVALALKGADDPAATRKQATEAAKYAKEIADIKSRAQRVTINPSSTKERKMATSKRNGPRAKRKRREEGRQAAKATPAKKAKAAKKKTGGAGSGLKKANAVNAAIRKGVPKKTAGLLYDEGKLTEKGNLKKGSRDVPASARKALTKKPAKKKAAKKKTKKKASKKKTKSVAKKKTATKRAPPKPRKRAKKKTFKYRGTSGRKRTGGKSLTASRRKKGSVCYKKGTKKVSPSVSAAADRVRRGQKGSSGRPVAYQRWCRNFMNLKVAEKDLGDVE